MTIASLGTPASSCSRSPGRGAPRNAASSGGQDSEAPMSALTLLHRIQEPVKPKRRRGACSGEVICLPKKQRLAAVAESGLAPPSPIVREQDANKGAQGADHVEEEKVRPCQFRNLAVVHQDLACPLQKPVKRECCLIKKSYRSAVVAASNGINGLLLGQVTPSSPTIQEKKVVTARRRRGRINTKPSPDCHAYTSLASGLRCLGVTTVTPLFARILTRSDSCSSQSRLQISPREFNQSPLLSMLTEDEYGKVHTGAGLPVEALDRHGSSYAMTLGFATLSTGIAYRLRTGWTRFLARSGVREGDLVQVGAFRVHGRLMLMLLNYASDGYIPEEMEAADGLLMLSDSYDGSKSSATPSKINFRPVTSNI